MTGWQPLSVRRGRRSPEEPYEGVPAHMRYSLEKWLRTRFGWNNRGAGMNDQFMATLATSLRIPVTRTSKTGGISDQIIAALNRDEDLYLDSLDACLHLSGGSGANDLRRMLETGGSVWTVNSEGTGLECRVDATTKEAFLDAVDVADAASEEIASAWTAVYGRNPDPSDGWDHAIKAVEEVLIPLVVPKQTKANLGHVAGQLKANPSGWSFGLTANDVRSNGETLEGMIRHIWPNSDRHGGTGGRAPTQDEAEAVLQIAIAIIKLCRGKLVKTT